MFVEDTNETWNMNANGFLWFVENCLPVAGMYRMPTSLSFSFGYKEKGLYCRQICLAVFRTSVVFRQSNSFRTTDDPSVLSSSAWLVAMFARRISRRARRQRRDDQLLEPVVLCTRARTPVLLRRTHDRHTIYVCYWCIIHDS